MPKTRPRTTKKSAAPRKSAHARAERAIMRIPAPPAQPWNLTLDEVSLVRNHIAKGASDTELQFCLAVARRHRLDPFRGQIWFVKRRDSTAEGGYRWIPITGINGMLHIAARDHKDFGSNDEPEFGPMHAVKWSGYNGKSGTIQAPEWASVKLWKKGHEHPIVAKVFWEEIYPDVSNAPLVRQMPRLMLGKCALAQAVRRAYPATDGLYIKEEFQGPPEFTPGGRVMEVIPAKTDAELFEWEAGAIAKESPDIREAVMKKLTPPQREIVDRKIAEYNRRETQELLRMTDAEREGFIEAQPKAEREAIRNRIIEEAATKTIAIISYPEKEDGDVELRADTATAAYAGLKRPHSEKQGVWLIKFPTIDKFHDLCRDKGITVNEEISNA